jgi:hypothetical protein
LIIAHGEHLSNLASVIILDALATRIESDDGQVQFAGHAVAPLAPVLLPHVPDGVRAAPPMVVRERGVEADDRVGRSVHVHPWPAPAGKAD